MILVFVGLFLITLAYGLFSAGSKKPSGKKIHETGKRGDPGICPVCGSVLKKSESLKSAVYPGKEDKKMRQAAFSGQKRSLIEDICKRI